MKSKTKVSTHDSSHSENESLTELGDRFIKAPACVEIFRLATIAAKSGLQPVVRNRWVHGKLASDWPLFLITVASVVFLVGCDAATQRQLEAVGSEAKSKISNLKAVEDSRLVYGEPDYGMKVSFTIQNDGEAGIITVMPWVSSSEGEWTRTQRLHFKPGQSIDLTYFFHEPTINAENIQFGVKARP